MLSRPVPQALISRSSLLANPSGDISVLNEGVQKVTDLLHLVDPAGQETAMWILGDTRFQRWFQSGDSQLLAVNPQVISGLISPCSLICATLVMSVHGVSQVVPLYAMCSLLPEVSRSSRFWLLSGLISQLVQATCPDAIPSPSYEDLGQLNNDSDPNPLWKLFVMLINRLEHATVFCILEGLDRYHDNEEANFLIEALQQLTAQGPPNVVINGGFLLASRG